MLFAFPPPSGASVINCCYSTLALQVFSLQSDKKSGRLDLNQRPPAPKAANTDSQADNNKALADTGVAACTNACTSNDENGPNQAGKLEVIADLLAGLPEAERRDVITELAPADRVAVARLLIARSATEGKGETP